MPDTSTGRDHPARYEIRIQGHLDSRWTTQLDGMNLECANDGTTLLTGLVIDQAALHGLMTKLRDLGLFLVSVNQLGTDGTPLADDPSTPNPLDTTPQGH